MVGLAYSCLTPQRAETFPLPRPGFAPLADLLSPASVEERPDWVCVEGEYARCIAITDFPREVSVGWLAPLILDDSMIDIVQFFHPQDAHMMIRHYRRRKAEFRATRQINRKRGVVDDPEEEVAAGDVEHLLARLASREERLFEVGLYIIVRASDPATLDERTMRVMSVLKNLFVVARPATFEQLPAFLSAQPLGTDLLKRTCLLDTRSLATAVPFISDALYMPDGVLEGITTNGKPVVIDDWDDALDNPHRFIGAITGAGKSYQCKLKMLRESLVRYHENIQIAVIDPEQEYERMCREVGGTMVRIAPGSAQHLNPFDLVPPGINLEQYCLDRTHGDRLAEKVQSLHTLYDFMLSDRGPTGATTLSVREKGLLDRATYEVYRAANITADPTTHLQPAPLLKDLYTVLVSGVCGKDDYGLADRLYRFVEGSLAGTFSAPTDVALADRFVVFDILDMAGELRPIGIFLIADCMWTQVLASHRPRALYIDEAWSLIQHPEGGRFLADLARRARKRYLRIVTITQSPELFVDDQWGAVIAGNAATKILKKQDHTSIPTVASRFQLTRAERQKLLMLAKNEALLLTGGNHLVLTVEANPLEHRLATTNPRDVALFAEEMEVLDEQ
jgi:type IV secretory pathway VirB4 component